MENAVERIFFKNSDDALTKVFPEPIVKQNSLKLSLSAFLCWQASEDSKVNPYAQYL